MRKMIFHKISILFFILISILFFVPAIAQRKANLKTNYVLTLKSDMNSKVKIEVTVIKKGKRHSKIYLTPTTIKYEPLDMTILIMRIGSKKNIEYRLSNKNDKVGELYGTTTTNPEIRFEILNGTFSANKIE